MKLLALSTVGMPVVLSLLHPVSVPAQTYSRGGRGGTSPSHNTGPHHPGGGMEGEEGFVHPLIRQQMQQAYQQELQRQQMEAQQQYERQVQQFQNWLRSSGDASRSLNGAGSQRLPQTPEAFDQWATNQSYNKAHGKPYEHSYDLYLNFVGSMNPIASQQGATRTARSKTALHGRQGASRKEQSATSGSMAGGAEVGQGTKERPSTQLGASTIVNGKPSNLKREPSNAGVLDHGQGNVQSRALQKPASSQNQVIISHLRTVLTRLREADRDYDGHLEKAARAVGEALKQLGSSTPIEWVTFLEGRNLPQSRSDEILRLNLHQLNMIESQLSQTTAGEHHHAQARADVARAIQHLEAALAVR